MTATMDVHGPRGARQQRGVALVVVLWALVLLTIMVGSQLLQSRTHARMAWTVSHAAQARALAEGAVYQTIAALVAIEPPTSFDLSGTVFTLPSAGDAVRVKVENEAGKLDLNAANAGVFERVLSVLEVSARDQRRLSDALADFRDGDGLTRPDGAEDADYAQAGLTYGAKDAPLAAVEELQQVLGVTPALFAALAPELTVYGRRATVDLRYAGPLLQRAFAPANAAESTSAWPASAPSSMTLSGPAATALRGSLVTTTGAVVEAPNFAPTPALSQRAALGTYTVRAEAVVVDVTVGIDTVVTVSRRPGSPYTVLAWRERPQRLGPDPAP